MSWHPIARLGLSGQELDIPCKAIDIQVTEGNVQLEQRNLSGAMLRSYIRHNSPTVVLSVAMLPDAIMAILRGLQASLSALNFIFNQTLAVTYLMGTSETTTKVVIPLTSATGVTITGVYLQSDTFQSGTNYYTSGSFDAATGIITLGSALSGANTDVWVNYTFTGLSCWLKANVKPHQGGYAGYWQGTLELTGA